MEARHRRACTWKNCKHRAAAAAGFDTIKALPVSRLARGEAILFLWATGAMLPQQIDVLRAWGFVYKTQIVWRKVTINGKVRWGTGYRARTGHENVLVGTIGNPSFRGFPSIFDGFAREHSRKPDEFYDIVGTHTRLAVRRADLFSRESRAGFEGWGNEHGKFDKAA